MTDNPALRFQRPTSQQLADVAEQFHISLADGSAQEWLHALDGTFQKFEEFAHLAQADRPRRGSTTALPARTPDTGAQAHEGWAEQFILRDKQATGPLTGRTVAVKDNICVAGAPATAGAAQVLSYTAPKHARVVERVLAAGGEIRGIARCEGFCVSGSSHTCGHGSVRNPFDPTLTSGGSSSGSAVLVAAGEVDVALGTDTAGSVRIPSSWCGIYGLKPTAGLVSLDGVIPVDSALDTVGVMARNPDDLRRVLEAVAEPSALAAFRSDPARHAGQAAPGKPHGDLTIGLLVDGFGIPNVSDPDVDAHVSAYLRQIADNGIAVREVSVAEHRSANAVRTVLMAEGLLASLVVNHGVPYGQRVGAMERFPTVIDDALRHRNDLTPAPFRALLLAGAWLRSQGHGEWYSAALNAMSGLAASYDACLADVDVIAMPTVPILPFPLPERHGSVAESVRLSRSTGANTAPLNVSGHPAITVPIGLTRGLPVGLMLVGRRGSDFGLIEMAGRIAATP